MILEIFLFVLGLAILVKGSDYLVKAASAIAKRLGVSEFIIGLTVVAFGTSVPELANAITASLVKDSGLIMGNIIGANIANIGLIMGSVALAYTLKTKKTILHRDGYFMMFAVFLFYLFILDMKISRVDALISLFFYAIYILVLAEKRPDRHIRDFIRYFFISGFL